MATELYRREIVWDGQTGDYTMLLDGEPVGFARNYHEAEITLDQLVYELLSSTPPAPADVLPGFPGYAALSAFVDVPLDGPSEDEEGGEGGEPPPDEALAWERLHAACIAAAYPLGGPARCDVRGCPSLGVDRTVGGVRAYLVTLCGPHAAELNTAVGVAP